MKFVLFVEGHTEKVLPSFLKRWLDPQLALQGRPPVGIQAVRFEGQAEFIQDVAQKTKLHINAPKRDVIAVIGLLDLHGASIPYPPDVTSVTDRCAWASKHLEATVNHPQFRQYFAVHETEAWLLSNPNIFPTEIKPGLMTKTSQPETVNSNEPPAKLLDRLYLSKTNRHYKKVITGTELFARLDPEIAYNKCPSLKGMLDDMLRLALNPAP